MIRAFSFGGGVQSTAALVLAAERKIDFPTFLFANVGEDSESPATTEYIEEISKPYAAAYGLEFVTVQKLLRDGTPDTILGLIDRTARSIPIPVHFQPSGQGNRACTVAFKVQPIDRELRRRGATLGEPATIGIGISMDEFQRMRTDPPDSIRRMEYPLIDLGLTREDCKRVIAAAGLPEPPRSSCFYCPMHSKADWLRLRKQEPALYQRAIEIEATLNAKRRPDENSITLSRDGVPLADRLNDPDQLGLFDADEGACSLAGYCHV